MSRLPAMFTQLKITIHNQIRSLNRRIINIDRMLHLVEIRSINLSHAARETITEVRTDFLNGIHLETIQFGDFRCSNRTTTFMRAG